MSVVYKYRTSLEGHSSDVRAVVTGICPSGSLVTCSRDKSARIWVPDASAGDSRDFTTLLSLQGHSSYVMCACVVPPSDGYPDGLIATGGNDANILLYAPTSTQPVMKLTGHQSAVSTLASGKFGVLVSGSWDATARLWQGDKCVLTLEGHEAAVWAVALVPGASGWVLTGSADKSIQAWSDGRSVRRFDGHTDCVRALAILSEQEFVSCANDASLRRWNVSGDCLAVLYGHSNYVYGLAVLSNGRDLVSCGEDRSLRVWRQDQLEQTISVPAQSVWSVACLESGDIAAACSDGTCRIFSASSERQAPSDVIQAFDEQLAATQLSKADIGGYKISDLPGVEALLAAGRSDGQTLMVRDGQDVTCHRWSAGDQQWLKIGDVVGASGGSNETSGKTLYEGKEYDFVFSVDVQEGSPPLKLPYNLSQDPWSAAQQFIHKNDLSQQFLEQVANFIITNSGGDAAASSSSVAAGGADPFTGGSRYVPSSSSSNAGHHASSPPPAYTPSPSTPRYFPQSEFVFFDKGNVAGMSSKLMEFNDRCDAELRLDQPSLQSLLQLAESDAVPEPDEQQLGYMLQLLSWPEQLAFPALDLLRMALRHEPVSRRLCETAERRDHLLASLRRYCGRDAPTTCQMVTLRAASNMFHHVPGEQALRQYQEPLSAAALSLASVPERGLQVAVSTLLLNLAVSARRLGEGADRVHVFSALATALQQMTDSEAQFRALVGLGSLADDHRETARLGVALGVRDLLSRLRAVPEPQRVADCAAQVDEVLARAS